ncbi:MAG: hypothetical protein HPM95_16700 [Alphaproteobacteria bacterium]|nr:hypothetical protein [Alphaproteobacteria bacterium]
MNAKVAGPGGVEVFPFSSHGLLRRWRSGFSVRSSRRITVTTASMAASRGAVRRRPDQSVKPGDAADRRAALRDDIEAQLSAARPRRASRRCRRAGREIHLTMDLIGLPWQLVVRSAGWKDSTVELKNRAVRQAPRDVGAGRRQPPDRSPVRHVRFEQGRKRAQEAGMTDGAATTGDVSETRMFAGFEWMLASRYLRSRRREAPFISGDRRFSFLGIMLGVATLIIVIAVMNGFRGELLSEISASTGICGPADRRSETDDYDAVAADREPGNVTFASLHWKDRLPGNQDRRAFQRAVRRVREVDLRKLPLVADTVAISSSLGGFDRGAGGLYNQHRMAQQLGVAVTATASRWSARKQSALGVTRRA